MYNIPLTSTFTVIPIYFISQLLFYSFLLRYIGGVYGGNVKPTPFLCLILKMLQIQPEKDIIVEFIKNEEFKYVRALGALYMRLTGSSLDCYKYLEPLFNDNRKLRKQNKQGFFELIHMDEFIDELLREERSCDVILPRIQKRHVLEENNELGMSSVSIVLKYKRYLSSLYVYLCRGKGVGVGR